MDRLKSLLAEAQTIGRPKGFYKVAYIQEKKDDRVLVEGITFTSRVLRVNVEKAHRIFPYIATCGEELEEWSKKFEDFLDKYLADAIKEKALRLALDFLYKDLVNRFQPGKLSRMNPGSLPDWPLPEQVPLFTLLGEGPSAIGVKLNESFLMMPIKSVSGIWFPTEENFESCRLCPRENCPGRRAAYVPGLYDQKYGLSFKSGSLREEKK
ncbi:MAG: vitamin B12 dependent-methionine synthase activation domain-containing protein [bacterium]